MPLTTENPYNSVYEFAPEENKLLSAINASTMRDDKTTPDEFAMQNYRGPSFEPRGRILPTVKETGQAIGSVGSTIGGLMVGGTAEIGAYINRLLRIDNVLPGAEMEYWQNKFAYYPTEPVAQRAVEGFNLPFEALRFAVDKLGHGVQDGLLYIGTPPEIAADVGATIALLSEFKILKFTNDGIRKIKGIGGVGLKSAIGRLNEILRGEKGDVSIKDAISALKTAMKDEIPMENLSEIQRDALDAITKSEEVPIIDYMDHIESLTSEGIVKAFNEQKKVPKKTKRTKVKSEELKVGDVSGATEIIKETENVELIKPTNIAEDTITYKNRSGNVYTKRGDQWFDKNDKVVTNKTILKAAERKQVVIKNITTDELVPESKLDIPDLTSTGDSVAFSKIVTKEQLVEVERLKNEHGEKAQKLLDEADKVEDKTTKMNLMNQAMEESTKSQLYREVIEAKNEPERFDLVQKELPLIEEPVVESRPKITKTDKAQVTAKAHGIEFVSEEMVEEFIRETDTTPTKVPHYQFFDPVTGEYFLSRSPSAKVVGEELAILRELRSINNNVNKKITFEDLNREANDIMKGVSKTTPEDFLKTLRSFTENIAEEDIGPGKRFETTADAMEHADMGREFASRFRREMIKRGKMEESGVELYSGFPIHLAKDIVKDINNTFKAVYRGLSERLGVKGLKPEDAKTYDKILNDHEAATSSSEQRGIYEIGNDLVTLEDFGANERFTIDKLKALQLLESDAKRLKQPFNDYLAELGFTPEQIQRALGESSKWKNKIEPMDDTVPIEPSPNEADPIVKQHQWKAKDKSIVTAPSIHASDIKMMEDAVELPPQVGFKTLGTMIRIFEDAGLKPIYNAWREADANVAREGVAVDNFLNDIKSRYKLNRKNRQNIMTYAYQQQERGMAILEANKLKPVTLTPDELNAYSEMRTMYEDYFDRINAVRRSIGREPIKKVDNYFTFARVINNLQREGIVNNLIREDATLIMNQYTHFKSTPFRFARVRTGGFFNPELDSFKVFKMYSDNAARHINISPVAAKVNELTNTRIPLSDGSGSVQYSVVKPNTGRFLNDWSDFISGKPVVSKWPGWIGDRGLRLLRKNIAYSTLQWNARSFLIQPAAIQNSLTELGLKYVSEGFVDNLKPEMRKFAMEKSNHLITRVPETEINDWAYLGKIWKAGFKPMQWTDLETARTTWLGAYKFGKEVHGLGGKELINFADDVVVRTQGSAGMGDIATIQRSEMGKALTMFQTFTINNWDFITKDVLGLKGMKLSRPLDVQKVTRLILATTAINILYEDIFGIPSPNPRPVKELIDGISDGKSFGKIAMSTAKELLEPVPIIGGSFKYGKQVGGPVFETLSNIGEKFTNDPMQKDWLEILSMVSGVPGTRQVIKYQKGQKRGESFTGSLLGTYSNEQGSSGRPSRSGRSSRGSR